MVLVGDEDLRRARVRLPRSRERDEPAQVRLDDRVVGERRVLPLRGDLRVAGKAELHHEIRDSAEEARVVVKPELHEIVEAVRRVGRPAPVNFDEEVALGRREVCEEDLRRLGGRERRVELLGCVVNGRWQGKHRRARRDGHGRGRLLRGRERSGAAGHERDDGDCDGEDERATAHRAVEG